MGIIIYEVVNYAFQIYYYIMLIYIIMSWIPNVRDTKFGVIVGKLVDWYLDIFRKFIPPFGMIDFSPIFAFIAYTYIQKFALLGLSNVLAMAGLK